MRINSFPGTAEGTSHREGLRERSVGIFSMALGEPEVLGEVEAQDGAETKWFVWEPGNVADM